MVFPRFAKKGATSKNGKKKHPRQHAADCNEPSSRSLRRNSTSCFLPQLGQMPGINFSPLRGCVAQYACCAAARACLSAIFCAASAVCCACAASLLAAICLRRASSRASAQGKRLPQPSQARLLCEFVSPHRAHCPCVIFIIILTAKPQQWRPKRTGRESGR